MGNGYVSYYPIVIQNIHIKLQYSINLYNSNTAGINLYILQLLSQDKKLTQIYVQVQLLVCRG